ncbi:hypothetical protein BLA60_08660 [Actinophytocola xinjiangensis]|uniref:non-specific serine/threonine protein kinase n=2 Tax=Actinophytocola xinjiangensis TaxID=485602 RepID=A0A7Z1B0H9_9PSEU|nr:hypothetical protein BLA60_08660 [Actinophytocola xinjiangensis]
MARVMFGRYRVEELLGRGGMGEVHRAHDTEHDRVVALKRLTVSLTGETSGAAEALARFRRESRIAASLDGPHITTVHDYGEVDGQLYLAMRLVEGTDLRRLLDDGPLPAPRAMTVLTQVAVALDTAHAAGVVHRDVKPSNILLDADGTAYLADFGIAKSLAPEATSVTRSGEIGTLDYMAPERLMNRPADHRADVYALACVLFECLTGKKPFPADDPAGKLAAQLNDAPPAPSLFDWRVPRAVDLVVATGMDKEPDRRYPSAGELMAAAATALRQQAATAPLTAPALAGEPGQGGIMDAIVAVAAGRVAGERARLDLCPYPGLRSFSAADSELFVGREHAVTDVLVRLSRQSAASGPLLVVGASGSGKSSLLRAGVLPALATAREPWPRLVTTPGPHPMRTLAARLAPIADADADGLAAWLSASPAEFGTLAARLAEDRGARLVLVVDQFEELFTVAAPAEREAFATLLANAWPALVVVAVRADHVDQCLRLAPLRPAMASPYPLGPLTRHDLERVIVEPALSAGLGVEEGLVDRLITDIGAGDAAGYDPGALPRLAHALRQTWENRDGSMLTLRGYQDTGGVDRAVALTADGVYNRLPEGDRAVLRAALLRMVAVLDGGGVARRRAPLAEIPDQVLTHLVAARLVTAEADGVQLAHDALLTAWPRLREWVEQDRQDLVLRQHLGQASAAWRASGRDHGELYGGARLAATLEWAQGREDLTDTERGFLRESRRVQQRTTRRLRGLVTGLAVFLVVALVAGAVAAVKWGEATREADTARSRLLAAESLADSGTDPNGAARRALAAWHTSRTAEARGALLSAATRDHPVTYATGLDQASAVDVSPDGRLVAAGGPDGELTVVDTATGRPVDAAFDGHTTTITDVEFSPNGTVLATASESADLDQGVRLWSMPGGRLLHTLNAGNFVAWRADGEALAAPASDGTRLGVSAWDPATGAATAWLAGPYTDAAPLRGAYSQDGTRFAVGRGDGAVELWDAAAGTRLRVDTRHVEGATTARSTDPPTREPEVAFNHDLLVSASYLDGRVRFADARTGRPRGRALEADYPGIGLNLTVDGAHLLTIAAPAVGLTRWNVPARRRAGGYAQAPGEGGVGAVVLVSVGASAAGVVAGQVDGDVVVWPANPGWYFGPAEPVYRVAFGPDGEQVSAVAGDGFHNWDPRTGRAVPAGYTAGGGPFDIGFLPDGTRVVGSVDGAVTWVPPDGEERSVGIGTTDRIVDGDLTVSGDGELVAVKVVTAGPGGGKDTSVYVWAARSLERRAVLDFGADVTGQPVFSPDGERLLLSVTDATTTEDPGGSGGRLRVWRTSDFTEREPLATNDHGTPTFTPDGRVLVTSGGTRVQVRDPDTGAVRLEFGEHAGEIRALAVSPDGRLVATGTVTEPVVRLWDLTTGTPLATLTGHGAGIHDLVFSPDGRTLASAGEDSDVGLWTVRPEDALRRVCDDLGGTGDGCR